MEVEGFYLIKGVIQIFVCVEYTPVLSGDITDLVGGGHVMLMTYWLHKLEI